MSRILTCVQWDDATQDCVTTAWVEPQTFGLPPLTESEGAQLGGAVLVLFSVAFLLRLLRKQLEQM